MPIYVELSKSAEGHQKQNVQRECFAPNDNFFKINYFFQVAYEISKEINAKTTIFQKFDFHHFFQNLTQKSILLQGLFFAKNVKNLTKDQSNIILNWFWRIFHHSENYIFFESIYEKKLPIYVELSKSAKGHQKQNVQRDCFAPNKNFFKINDFFQVAC